MKLNKIHVVFLILITQPLTAWSALSLFVNKPQTENFNLYDVLTGSSQVASVLKLMNCTSFLSKKTERSRKTNTDNSSDKICGWYIPLSGILKAERKITTTLSISYLIKTTL